MSLTSSCTKSLCVTAMTVALATAAHAAALRTFVSGGGNDANTASNCAHAAPCRTLAVALTVTSSGGEIAALDPAGYGPITISGKLSLVGVPGAAINAPANGIGITINAGAGNTVEISNFQIVSDGLSNTTGIAVNSGNLVLRNSALKFLSTGMTVTNTKASLFHVDIIGNSVGISATGTGPNPNVFPFTGTTEVLLFWGSAFDNTTAFLMNNPGTNTPNILEWLSDPASGFGYSTGIAGNGTLVNGMGTGCPGSCTSLGTFEGATNPN